MSQLKHLYIYMVQSKNYIKTDTQKSPISTVIPSTHINPPFITCFWFIVTKYFLQKWFVEVFPLE